MLFIYSFIASLFHHKALLWLEKRVAKGKEDPLRFKEKLGIYKKEFPFKGKNIIHLHGASVGEVRSLLPIIEFIHKKNPDYYFVITSSTKTSADMLKNILPDYVYHIYFPIDTPQAVKKFLAYVQPKKIIITESEIWPNFLHFSHKNKIPIYALNMILSQRSLDRWQWGLCFIKKILSYYSMFLVQNEATALFIKQHSNKKTYIMDNIKYAAKKETYNQQEFNYFQNKFQDKKIILLLSTHDDEEKQFINLFKPITKQRPDLQLIIIPRHPYRMSDIEKSVDSPIYKYSKVNTESQESHYGNIFFVDVIGKVSLFCALSDVTIIGNSFNNKGGGHNPIEPALYKTALITGSKTQNLEEIISDFKQAQAIIITDNAQEAFQKAIYLIDHEMEKRSYIQRAETLYQKKHQKITHFINEFF